MHLPSYHISENYVFVKQLKLGLQTTLGVLVREPLWQTDRRLKRKIYQFSIRKTYEKHQSRYEMSVYDNYKAPI